MRAVVQRVSRARVSVKNETVGEIGPGLVVLLGIAQHDTEADAEFLATKIVKLRIFEDDQGKMNRALLDAFQGTRGAVLAVSQFTLLGDARGQNRPSFIAAARPEVARPLYEHFVAKVREAGVPCETGRFQEMMAVELVNDGPVTILLDSEKQF